MTVPVYIVSSHMIGQRSKLDMVADNVANANTTGYKKLGMSFSEIVSRKQTQEVASFTHHNGTHYDFSQGGLTRTDNDLDMSITGAGFFATERNGQTHYTRNGSFGLSPEGNLITGTGSPVLDTNGGPINIPADSTKITVTQDGTIANQNGPLANIGIFNINEPQKLIRTGSHGYIYNGAEPTLSTTASITQGFVENANINPIEETVNLTEINRSYTSSSKLVKSLEEIQQNVIRNLSRLPQ